MLNSQMTGKERILCAMKGDTPELDKDGIAPGDWFVVYGIRPGLKVNVASECSLNDAPDKKIVTQQLDLQRVVQFHDRCQANGEKYAQ